MSLIFEFIMDNCPHNAQHIGIYLCQLHNQFKNAQPPYCQFDIDKNRIKLATFIGCQPIWAIIFTKHLEIYYDSFMVTCHVTIIAKFEVENKCVILNLTKRIIKHDLKVEENLIYLRRVLKFQIPSAWLEYLPVNQDFLSLL